MAAAKNATATKEAVKLVKEYKVTGKGFKSKSEAIRNLKRYLKKALRVPGLWYKEMNLLFCSGHIPQHRSQRQTRQQ